MTSEPVTLKLELTICLRDINLSTKLNCTKRYLTDDHEYITIARQSMFRIGKQVLGSDNGIRYLSLSDTRGLMCEL